MNKVNIMKNQNNNLSKILYYSIIISSIIIAIFTMIRFSNIHNMFLLGIIPLVYAILCSVSKKNKHAFSSNVGITILNIMMYLRYTIYILLMDIDYIQRYLINSNFILSVGLIIIEMLSIFLVITVFYKKKPSTNVRFTIGINIPLLIPFLITIILLIAMPETTINSLFYINGSNKEISTNGLQMFVYFSVDVLFFLILALIYKVKNISESNKVFYSLIVSVLFVITKISSFSSNISRWNFLLYSISAIYLLAKLYPRSKNKVIGIFVPAVLVGIVILTILKFNFNDNIFIRIFNPDTFDVYLNGFQGIIDGIIINNLYDSKISFSMMFNDLFSAIPIFGAPFRGLSSTDLYHQYLNRTDLILPMVSQSYLHFGIAFAGLFSGIMTYIIIQVNNLMNKTTDFYFYSALILILVWFSFFMGLNINIIFENTWRKLIFAFLMYLNMKILYGNASIKDNLMNYNHRDSGVINEYNKMSKASNPYGDGLASKRIANILED